MSPRRFGRWAGVLTAQALPPLLALDRRVLRALLGLLLLFVALECWLLVLRGPFTEWRELRRQRADSPAASPVLSLQAEVERQRLALERAEQALRRAGLPQADDDMVLHLMATLAPVARRHGVQLGPIRAAGRSPAHDLQQVAFDCEARGGYLALIAWLGEVEPLIAPLQAREFQLVTGGEALPVSMRVKFSAYLPLADTPGVPK